MNNFKKYRLLFLENKISKVEFIDFMYNIHQTLFEYSDEIKNKSYLLAFIENALFGIFIFISFFQ